MQTESILSVSPSSQHSSLTHRMTESSYEFGFERVKDIPPPTAEDLIREKDPEAYDRRELAKVWRGERPEFNRLKRLARALGIEKVVVSPESALPDLKGWYVYSGWEVDSLSAQGWGLSKNQIRSINRKEGPAILIDYHSCSEQGASRTLGHEIGHHLYRLAQFTADQRRDEICAECFAEYLTVPAPRSVIKRHCDSILQKVRVHNPKAAKLVASYRRRVEICGKVQSPHTKRDVWGTRRFKTFGVSRVSLGYKVGEFI